jgi:hypothetical protein
MTVAMYVRTGNAGKPPFPDCPHRTAVSCCRRTARKFLDLKIRIRATVDFACAKYEG